MLLRRQSPSWKHSCCLQKPPAQTSPNEHGQFDTFIHMPLIQFSRAGQPWFEEQIFWHFPCLQSEFKGHLSHLDVMLQDLSVQGLHTFFLQTMPFGHFCLQMI